MKQKTDMQGHLKTMHMDSIAEAISVAVGDLTGTVIDSGEGCTHVVPIVTGYVVTSAIRTVPLAGADATLYIQRCLRDRGQPLPSDHSLDHCRCEIRPYTGLV
jgi:actin-related protein